MKFNPNQVFSLQTRTGLELAQEILDLILEDIVLYFEENDEDDIDEVLTVKKEDMTLEWLYTFLTDDITQKYYNIEILNDIDEEGEIRFDLIDSFLKEQKIIINK